MPSSQQSCSARKTGREAKARIEVDVAGGRTVIRRQHVGYPLHVTRGFYLDRERPDLLTLYLQSASGGLYAGDRLQLDVVVANGAALCVTTQASTVVHDGKGVGALQRQNLTVGAGAFCALVCDPSVMFPNADLTIQTSASVAEDSVLIVIDGLSYHDPAQRNVPFAAYRNELTIVRADGKLLLSDIGELRGDRIRQLCGPIGDHGATATMTIIAPPSRLPDRAELERNLASKGCLAGASAAPHGAGLVTRILAPSGGNLLRGLEVAFQLAGNAASGAALVRRRK